MDQERSDVDKLDEVMLPGFRFHPTDEELVGFYLKKKIQQRPLSVELIRQLDIYKHDPWDLPKLAATGEKEWYFYCPRDRKYRNSARPNRVTGAGFWKATGTDRPIYSSDGTTKCIGLKKSLVFYKGRAAKGIKTDWMMHEFRLPSLTDHSGPPKRYMDKTIPANDSWAICRIFKKTNSTAHRALSHSWVTPLTETFTPKTLIEGAQSTRFSSDHNISIASNTSPAMHFSCNTNDFQQSSVTNFSSLDNVPYFKSSNPTGGKPSQLHLSPADQQLASNFMFSTTETSGSPAKSTVDVSSMLLNMSSYSMFGDFGKASESVDFGGSQEHCNGFSITLPQEIQVANLISKEDDETTAASLKNDHNVITQIDDDDQYWAGTVRSLGFSPLGLPLNMSIDAWKSNFLWDSSPCPTEMSTTYSSY